MGLQGREDRVCLVQGSRGWWATQMVAVLWDPGLVCV